jgi:hypothetical protein
VSLRSRREGELGPVGVEALLAAAATANQGRRATLMAPLS